MRLSSYKILFYLTCVLLLVFKAAETGVPFIFPLLSTSWYYKPGPMESIVLGLLVVKVLALRLGATYVGIPYHLNDIFDGTKLLQWNRGRRRRDVWAKTNQADAVDSMPLSKAELETVERLLLALRRIDSHDCFIQYICRVHQNKSNGPTNLVDETWQRIFRSKPQESVSTSIWNLYEAALSPRTNCSQKYSACPLTPADLNETSILLGMF